MQQSFDVVHCLNCWQSFSGFSDSFLVDTRIFLILTVQSRCLRQREGSYFEDPISYLMLAALENKRNID